MFLGFNRWCPCKRFHLLEVGEFFSKIHMCFMTAVHQGLVNNQWDTLGHWGARSLQSPDVIRREKKFKGRYTAKTPPTPITIVPAVKSPTNVTHELVLFKGTTKYQNMIRRKELPKTNRAQTRCVAAAKVEKMFSLNGFVWAVDIFHYAMLKLRGKCITIASRNTMLQRS